MQYTGHYYGKLGAEHLWGLGCIVLWLSLLHHQQLLCGRYNPVYNYVVVVEAWR